MSTDENRCQAVHPWSQERCALKQGHEGQHAQADDPDLSDDDREQTVVALRPELQAVVDKLRAAKVPWEGVGGVFFAEFIRACLAAGFSHVQIIRMQYRMLQLAFGLAREELKALVLEQHAAEKAAAEPATTAPGGQG